MSNSAGPICPPNVRLQPRRLMVAPAAVGGKPMLIPFIVDGTNEE
jgi:hypothetical protein